MRKTPLQLLKELGTPDAALAAATTVLCSVMVAPILQGRPILGIALPSVPLSLALLAMGLVIALVLPFIPAKRPSEKAEFLAYLGEMLLLNIAECHLDKRYVHVEGLAAAINVDADTLNEVLDILRDQRLITVYRVNTVSAIRLVPAGVARARKLLSEKRLRETSEPAHASAA